jgi:hypothetical protein
MPHLCTGYAAVNRLGALRSDHDIFQTFEGDNTVLLQQVGLSRAACHSLLLELIAGLHSPAVALQFQHRHCVDRAGLQNMEFELAAV